MEKTLSTGRTNRGGKRAKEGERKLMKTEEREREREKWEIRKRRKRESKRESERKSAGQVSAWVARAGESCRVLSEGKELVYCWYDTAALQRGKCEPSALLLLTRTKRTDRAHKHAPDTQRVCVSVRTRSHTHNAHSHCQCDKYGFSLVRIIHRGHLQDILGPFKLPPTSQKHGSNERGQTRAVLTGGSRSWGRTQLRLADGGGGEGGRMEQVAGH